jgi:TonB family protein
MAATAALLVVAVWLGWRMVSQRQARAAVASEAATVQVPAPGTVPASLQASPTPVVIEEILEETPPPATPTPVPSPTPAPAKLHPREVAPEDEVAVGDVEVIGPMKPGDPIRAGLPNVQVPVPKEFPAYEYPAAAVRIRVLVDENGQVIEAKVRDSGGPDFDAAALETARKTPFYPATRDEIPGRMWTELNFEFSE